MEGTNGVGLTEHTLSSRRDRALERCIGELRASHAAFSGLALDVAVRGGVAHVRGTVPGEERGRAVRAALSRVKGIHAVWDILKVEGGDGPRIVDLGCGNKKQLPEATGVDRFAFDGVDVVADLEGTLPFGDGTIDHVFAVHLLEHIRDLLSLMNEIHRILRPGGILHALVPNAPCANAVADPTHVRLFHPQTFKFFCRSYPGLRCFRPESISSDRDTIFADLSTVRPGEPLPSDEELAYFFD